MYTDFYITNKSLCGYQDYIVFFQKEILNFQSDMVRFSSVKNCQYNWSHKIRVFWDLSCRFVNSAGDRSSFYNLKMTYTQQKKLFLISKDGTISIQQSYGEGNQILNFEQIRGNGIRVVELYRDKLFIGEYFFTEKNIEIQMDTVISLAQYDLDNECRILEMEKIKNVLSVDFLGLKSVYVTLRSDKNIERMMKIDSIEKW